ncbi:MAG: YebC/PmpR family DNA-binding transcriptional regulator [Armatimonadetes bacterium]|nr:YebC/PmpR family DNA-binding transcriptional regulator [Armatimonadota bacterium]
MSGHSKWHNIRLRKGKQDAVRSKSFTKLAAEIIVAAKNGGGNVDLNLSLRQAVDNAKKASVPADNIKRAILRGTGEIAGANYEELTYEGYGPAKVAVLVQCLTDNKQRTVADVRSIFTKAGGKMGESGSIAHLFESKGIFLFEPGTATEETLMEVALEAGAEDITEAEGGGFAVETTFENFFAVKQAIDAAKLVYVSGETAMIPVMGKAVEGSDADALQKMIDRLEEHDDVQSVFTNAEFPDDEN